MLRNVRFGARLDGHADRGSRESIELKHWKEADDAIVIVSRVLQRESALIADAATKLEAATSH